MNVVPSDNLPGNSVSKVSGTGFFPSPTLEDSFVDLAQCVDSLEACGPVTRLPIAADDTFSGDMVLVRFLSVRDGTETVDCSELEAESDPPVSICHVEAVGGGFRSPPPDVPDR